MQQDMLVETVMRRMSSPVRSLHMRRRGTLKLISQIEPEGFVMRMLDVDYPYMYFALERWLDFPRFMAEAELNSDTKPYAGFKTDMRVWDATPEGVKDVVMAMAPLFETTLPHPYTDPFAVDYDNGWSNRDEVAIRADTLCVSMCEVAYVYPRIHHVFKEFGFPEHNTNYVTAYCALHASHNHFPGNTDDGIAAVVEGFDLAATLGSGKYIPDLVNPLVPEWLIPTIKSMYEGWDERVRSHRLRTA